MSTLWMLLVSFNFSNFNKIIGYHYSLKKNTLINIHYLWPHEREISSDVWEMINPGH